MLNPLRHQLPAYSPLPLRSLLGAGHGAGDPRALLSQLLETEWGADEVLLLESGTQALTLALEAAARGLPEKRAVALPAYSCFDVASAAVALDRPVRFYDLDPTTLGPDPGSLARTLERGVGVVVLAPLFGLPLDWHRLTPILDDAGAGSGGVRVVEDAAQGFGGRWEGRPLGSEAPLAVLSFGRGKGWTGGVGGGALLVRGGSASLRAVESNPTMEATAGPAGGLELNSGLAQEMDWELDSGGGGGGVGSLVRALALWGLARPGLYRVPRGLPFLGLGETHYRPPQMPQAMSALAARLIMGTEQASRKAVGVRRAAARQYREDLAHRAAVLPREVEGGEGGYLRFPVLLEGSMAGFILPDRARRLGAEAGYPRALPHLEALSGLIPPDECRLRWPGAASLVDGLVTLPSHPRTRVEERTELVELIPSR